MKKYKFFLFIFLAWLCILSACDDADTIPVNHQTSFFNVGNYWQYENGEEVKIDTTISINGLTYYRQVTNYDTTYMRIEDGKIYQGNPDGFESLKFNINAREGSNWSFQYSEDDNYIYNVTLVESNKTLVVNDHRFQNCKIFYFDIPEFADEESLIWVSPYYGVIATQSVAWGGINELDLVIIDDQLLDL